MKFVRKHRVGAVAAMVAMLVLLAIGLGYANWRAYQRTLGGISIALGSPMPGVIAWAQPLGDRGDPVGSAIRLGPTPIREARLTPGLYRFVIHAASERFAEFDEYLIASQQVERRVWLHSADEVRGGMIRFPAGEYAFTLDNLTTGVDEQQRARLVELLVDESEVTNREYEDFVKATGHSTPYHWPQGKLESAWDDLPVTGVTLADATAYAAWAGKRLPTIWEWMAFAQAPDGRLFPWGSGPIPPSAVPNESVLREEQDYSVGGAVAAYARRARPAHDGGETRSPLGLHHLFGNVGEMTGTVFLYKSQGGRRGVPNMVIARSDWTCDPAYANLSSIGLESHLDRSSPRIGFRCVRGVRSTIESK